MGLGHLLAAVEALHRRKPGCGSEGTEREEACAES